MSISTDTAEQSPTAHVSHPEIRIRQGLQSAYADIFTPEVLFTLAAMACFNKDQKESEYSRLSKHRRLNLLKRRKTRYYRTLRFHVDAGFT